MNIRLPSTPLVTLLAASGHALVLASGLALLPAKSAHAWWSCPTDKPNFEVRSSNSSHVRCTSEAQFRAHDECPNATAGGATIGTGIVRDRTGNHDKCVGMVAGQAVVVIDPTCNGGGPGYVLERRTQPNADRCVKPATQAAPTRNVN